MQILHGCYIIIRQSKLNDWVWRSLVARLNGVQEAGSSNLLTQTTREHSRSCVLCFVGVRTRTKSVLFCKTNARLPAGAVISVCVTAHRSSSMALDFAYAVDFASKKSVLMRFALEYWLTHAIDAGSVS